MDARGGLNEQEADRALRGLFREAGVVQAPPGSEARILQRIVLTRQRTTVAEPPLIPKHVWTGMLIAFILLSIHTLFQPATPSQQGIVRSLLAALPDYDISRSISLGTVFMACAGASVLIALDLLLLRKRSTRPLGQGLHRR